MKALACVGMRKSERSMIEGFRKAGLAMDEVPVEQLREEIIKKEEYLFVFTVNYSPEVSGKCQNLLMPYFSYIIEWPLRELYDVSVKNPCNFIFCFDREVYQWLHRILPERSYHLPLGGDVDRRVEEQPEQEELVDVSFVESVRQATDAYDKIEGISDYVRGYLEALLRVQVRIFGFNLLEPALNADVIKELQQHMPYEKLPDDSIGTDQNILANIYLADKVTEMTRTQYLEAVSEKFDTHVNARGRINLHMTHRAITTGVPQEVYDIMASGGFVLTNFQPEILELFVIGEHLETYSGKEECLEKIAYYLEHEEEREKIARAGQQAVREYHSCLTRAVTMFNTVFADGE